MKLSKIIPYLILAITFTSVAQWLNIDTNNLTIIWWTFYAIIILIFLQGRKINSEQQSLPKILQLFVYLTLAEAIYGVFLSDGYWDYKTLIENLFTFLLPLSFFVFSSPAILSNTIRKWLQFALIAFFFFIPIMQPEAPARYLIPIMFLLLFLKPLSFRDKFIVLFFFSFIFIYGSLGARSSVVKYSISFLMGLSLYTGIYKRIALLKTVHFVLIFIPFLFFFLGSLGIFNVFNFDEYLPSTSSIEVENSFNKNETETINADTRTFIYDEAISSAIRNQYVIQGHSLARGYESEAFADTDFYGRGERYGSEVSIINIFTYMGLMGVFIYFLIFYMASHKAIYQSNNQYMRMLGLFVSFRWVFSWIEDFSRFDLNYLFIWIMIAMCFSNAFLQMTDQEFENWARGIMGNIKKINK